MRTKDYDKQRRIKESMVRLILQDGLGGASVAKIAKDAGVSPATIYVYYDSKETMLAEVFREYSHESYAYLQDRIRPEMSGGELIEAIVRGFYTYTVEHEEIFSFVEQCTRCPSVTEEVSLQECCCGLFDLIHEYQHRGILNQYSDQNYAAVLFAPVRQIAAKRNCGCAGAVSREAAAPAGMTAPAEPAMDPEDQLDELVRMLQYLLVAGR